ncbi:hypothetical protein NT2_09_00840 [Caenibius tardaugens NBRC 16725]|uniref:HTH cro/C1-type domain-containing protein n=1 Tax=Caenibius tardaugens NBRC 16725 TaxID=1219035 RepID=U2YAM9_9SPHN|nr:helix-turn-helix domain-containing protein [Caenibius tardaugens]AZI35431.1 helix-turn-helix domain-containing protein [Caenibius tardaugens NBRC 16725]GAD50476.1 hypothetical protein NT2_09_00840 [Caenibius tardaugens NBRC 16725]
MANEAQLLKAPDLADQRGSPRRRLSLDATGKIGSAWMLGMRVLDLSETGILLESETRLPLDEHFEVCLPFTGLRMAHVVWAGGNTFGCQFDEPIGPAIVAAVGVPGGGSRSLSLASGHDDPADGAAAGESFGARLKRLRRARRITMVGLARQIGVSKPTIWKWEKNETHPREKLIGPLADALGVARSELLHGQAAPEHTVHAPADTFGDALQVYKAGIAKLAGTSVDKVEITIRL